MLVLTRKKSEMIQIGDDIVIKVIYAGRDTVKIGIAAPRNVRVLRAELLEPLLASNPLSKHLERRGFAALSANAQGVDEHAIRRPVGPVLPR